MFISKLLNKLRESRSSLNQVNHYLEKSRESIVGGVEHLKEAQHEYEGAYFPQLNLDLAEILEVLDSQAEDAIKRLDETISQIIPYVEQAIAELEAEEEKVKKYTVSEEVCA